MNSDNIDISGLDRKDLLKRLWTNMKVPAHSMGVFGGANASYSDAGASEALKGYIDYYQGRCIKTDLSKDSVDPYLYDRDAGTGTFAKIVAAMRAT